MGSRIFERWDTSPELEPGHGVGEGESARGLARPKTFRSSMAALRTPRVLGCGSPLPLFTVGTGWAEGHAHFQRDGWGGFLGWTHWLGWMVLVLAGMNVRALAQEGPPVVVTLRADAISLNPGESTTVRALAQVSPGFRARADRIFTWNLDLLFLAPEVIALEAGSVVRPRSDLDPVLGSAGTLDGPNLLGVRDSFLNLDGAGVATSIELFSVRVKAMAPGAGLMRLRVGTLGADSSPDFLVLPLGDEDPWSGADYSAAAVTVAVGGGVGPEAPRLRVERAANGMIRVIVEGAAGSAVALEESDRMGGVLSWRRVGASAAGSATFTFETSASTAPRFYRGVGLTAVP